MRGIGSLVMAGQLVVSGPATGAEEAPLALWAAGSLRAALTEVATEFARAHGGPPVATEFGASGTLRQRIEAGRGEGRPDVFASANLAHPEALAALGLGGPVVVFARNRLCALARPGTVADDQDLLDAMLLPEVRLGTSTPGADPSGDYAQALFAKAEAVRSGAGAALKAKAQALTGAPDSPKAPDGRNLYAWVVGEGRADLFLTYCTNAALARAERPDLVTVALPGPLAVGADYGLIVLRPERPDAWRLAAFVVSPLGQRVLARHGFETVGLPTGEGESP